MFKQLSLHFLKGILAGLAIGLGGFLYLLMCFLIPGEGGKILGSVLFAVGLFLVCTFGLSLYTGKIGLVFEGKKDAAFYWALPVMILGNAVGAVGLGYLCFAIFQNNEGFMAVVNNAANSRLVFNEFLDYFSVLLRSFLCGFCVYMAVKLFAKDRLKPLGILSLVFFVFLFVYCGFQHCIANMYYFGFANAYASGYAYLNLVLCILGNSFGPIMGVVIFRLLEPKKAEKQEK